ncbi:hypothetical protein LBMAG42_38520 [Deltaproteobacteria bacterium]|nr:hypothetical protein LBMAG42_38520 [Deltaproteobacteria bacterium]
MLVRLFAMALTACAPDVELNGLAEFDDPVDEREEFTVVNADEQPASVTFDLGLRVEPLVQEPEPELLADSVAEFSGVQGENGWWYGYIEPGGSNSFALMPSYVEGGTDPGWYAQLGGVYWTMMDASTMHPNGVTTTGGRQPVEQWAVRRWVSDVEGSIDVSGHFAKLSVDGESNGVGGYIFVDGVMSWAWYLEGWDSAGVDFGKTFEVHAGSTVDFMLDPWEADDRSDRSTLTAQIWSVVQ